jgi:Glutamyl-tRNAGlu reductase, dimerisation domain
MSGRTVSDLLRRRFDAIRESELVRLSKKLNGLAPDQRLHAEAIAADVVRAIALVPERALAAEASQDHIDALAHLFALDR